eukprot:TRINITY_DN17404_c0_g1_i2.p1 TRINITY_DN17404_c0_g1~~TRINITY_DN17404_c0_g1_i2.p1  ORF type:complete len:155 (-),score=28.95 TRINITY_DN17404_c0_g1_i2:35-499(-)
MDHNHLLTWKELTQTITEGRLEDLYRTPKDLEYYMAQNAKTLLVWKSVGDYILHREFGFDHVIENDKRVSVVPEGKVIKFVPNDYKYALDPSISHYLIWSTVPLKNEEIEAIIAEKLPQNEYESIYSVNPAHLQSIRNVYHAHVFFVSKEASRN